MIPPLITLFPTFVMTLVFFTLTVGIQTADGSSNSTTGIAIPIPNATLPGVDNSFQNEDEDTKTQAQNCQMPPCPPGEMCIQVCPESSPQ